MKTIRSQWLACAALLAAGLLVGSTYSETVVVVEDVQIAPRMRPIQLTEPQLHSQLIEASEFIRVNQARSNFNVDGSGFAVAVLDTGLRTSHKDFQGKVAAQKNYTTDNGGDENNASDGDGHGTNVGGIVVSNSIHKGIAFGAKIVPMKVLRNDGGGSFSAVEKALIWINDNHAAHNITVVNLSLGDTSNKTTDSSTIDVFAKVRTLIDSLAAKRIAVVISAGNDFHSFSSNEGMSFPGIVKNCISVGAVYDSANNSGYSYASGASTSSTKPGQITPFSQRLHSSTDNAHRTDIFAPGAPLTSSGIESDEGESIQHGTSQSAPVTAGVVLLLQQYYKRTTGELPTIVQLEGWLRSGGVKIKDEDPNNIDNVSNTNKEFIRLDALGSLSAAQSDINQQLLSPTGRAFKGEMRKK